MSHIFTQQGPRVSVGDSDDPPLSIPTPDQLGSILFTHKLGALGKAYCAVMVGATPTWVPLNGAGSPALAYAYYFHEVSGLDSPIPQEGAFPFGSIVGAQDPSGSITLPNQTTAQLVPGVYRIGFQASVTESGQICAFLDGVPLPSTEVGHDTTNSQLVIDAVITVPSTGPFSILQIINHSSSASNGNAGALTMTLLAGGDGITGQPPVIGLTIVRLA